jgi:hypothetical protein
MTPGMGGGIRLAFMGAARLAARRAALAECPFRSRSLA